LKQYVYKSDIAAAKEIFAKEGLRGLYRGYWTTFNSFAPFSACYFTCYEFLKGFYVHNDPQSQINKAKDGSHIHTNISFW